MSPLAERLLGRSSREGDCLRWQGAHDGKGYGQMRMWGRLVPVHRVAHEEWLGPIPAGYEVDHVYDRGCRYRDCIEPSHLEAVTHAENLRRAFARITECPRGHPLTGSNLVTYTTSSGGYIGRRCRTCRNASTAASKRRRKMDIIENPTTVEGGKGDA